MKKNNDYKVVSNFIARQPLTDEILLTNKDMIDLIELVEGPHIGTAVEADIIWADTCPLEHFSVLVTLNDQYVESVRWRFDIIDDAVPSPNGNDCHIFGVMTLTIKKAKNAKVKGGDIELVAPMACSSTQMLAPIDVWSASEGGIHGDFEASDPRWMGTFRDLLIRGVHMFYCIEVALLNPVIETVFVESANTVPLEPTAKHTGKNKRAKIRYVKRHIIHMSSVNTALEKRGFVRHTNLWYVTGHWREYQNGKRIFVKGYWKGALRSLKETLVVETRDREIVTA
jgi:hypothetical protein